MTPAPFAALKHAPTAVYLPACKYGCGEMLMTDEGYMCPICGRFMSTSTRSPLATSLRSETGTRARWWRRSR